MIKNWVPREIGMHRFCAKVMVPRLLDATTGSSFIFTLFHAEVKEGLAFRCDAELRRRIRERPEEGSAIIKKRRFTDCRIGRLRVEPKARVTVRAESSLDWYRISLCSVRRTFSVSLEGEVSLEVR